MAKRIRHKAIKYHRVPIIIKRTPIIDPEKFQQRMMEKLQAGCVNIQYNRAVEKEMLKIAHYYEYKCRIVNGVAGWRCLSNNYRQHRNWIHLARIYDICNKNQYDYKVYIDAQFNRVVNWTHINKKKYPYLSHCYSPAAIKSYETYVKDYKEMYSVTGDAKIKTSIPKSCKDEIIDYIINDCDRFVELQKKSPKMRKYRGLTPQQIKFMYIMDNVTIFSQYFWASLPWAVSYLQTFESPWIKEMVDNIKNLQHSKSIMKLIHAIVPEVERQMKVVSTLLPEEFAKTVE